MARKDSEMESNKNKQKVLINIGEHRKAWMEAVSGNVPDGSVTEVARCVIDTVSVEDPESFARKVEKWRVKAQLEEIERQEQELQARKAAIVGDLQQKGQPVTAAEY